MARDIALAIRAKIKAETGLNASAGISYNKFLAKLASDNRKPNGQYVITPEMGPGFVETLPVGKFHGIGPATNAKMNALGIFTGLDLRKQDLAFLEANFGKAGGFYYSISRGIDERRVQANRIRTFWIIRWLLNELESQNPETKRLATRTSSTWPSSAYPCRWNCFEEAHGKHGSARKPRLDPNSHRTRKRVGLIPRSAL